MDLKPWYVENMGDLLRGGDEDEDEERR